jgi:hypothetical protein
MSNFRTQDALARPRNDRPSTHHAGAALLQFNGISAESWRAKSVPGAGQAFVAVTPEVWSADWTCAEPGIMPFTPPQDAHVQCDRVVCRDGTVLSFADVNG